MIYSKSGVQTLAANGTGANREPIRTQHSVQHLKPSKVDEDEKVNTGPHKKLLKQSNSKFNLNLRANGLTGDDQFLWQTRGGGRLRAILFVAHGCGHAMTDWWAPDDSCPNCIGLPEERAIVEIALNLNLVVVAMSSLDRRHFKCWSEHDGPVVAKVLKQLQDDLRIPILAFGASSGGRFVSTLLEPSLRGVNVSLSGYISQISAPFGPSNVPAVLITMNRDLLINAEAVTVVEELTKRKVPALHIRVPPVPVTANYFAERIGSVYALKSPQMVQTLHAAGILSDEGMLVEDPRQSGWRLLLAPFAVNDTLRADQSPLSEVINAAWGMHEMTRDGVHEGLEFLLQHTALA